MDFRHELVIPNEDIPFRMFIFEGKDGNYQVGKHWHHSVEIFLVLEGEIGFYINSHHILLKNSDFVIVNSNEIHSIDSPEPNKTVVIQIPVDIFSRFMMDQKYTNFKKKSMEKNEMLSSLIHNMYFTYEQRELGYELLVKSHFYNMLFLLITEFGGTQMEKNEVRQKKHLDRLAQVTQYMEEHYKEHLTLEGVSKRFGFTPTYLSRFFQKYADVSYQTYLTDVRIMHAVRELVNTHHHIGNIALEHGFTDGRAFSNAFKKRYGCLPRNYRKKME